ncbi:MAG: YggS family pyridoxal phosphate-dependent enzyme [Candidatus Aureabacteria bacterium]|nr:YggS family pyridoxal phosphate-dependent enzyme [Candidatus Auribacterota bacterium]
MTDITEKYKSVVRNITDTLKSKNRSSDECTLILASKYASIEKMQALIDIGHRHFGENKLQDAEKKKAYFSNRYSDLVWHMIGNIQSNKSRKAIQTFDQIQTVDRIKILERLENAAVEMNKCIPIMLQVNLEGEKTKSGVLPNDVYHLFERSVKCQNLKIEGLMTIPPYFDDPEEGRPIFIKMKELQLELNKSYGKDIIRHLSMGMSDDYVVAIEEGATFVRIGSAIFED